MQPGKKRPKGFFRSLQPPPCGQQALSCMAPIPRALHSETDRVMSCTTHGCSAANPLLPRRLSVRGSPEESSKLAAPREVEIPS